GALELRAQRLERLLGPPGGADHGVDAVFDQPAHVLGGDRRDGEVDRDLRTRFGDRGELVPAADARDQLEVRCLLDGAAGGGAHPPGGAEHGDAGGAGRGVRGHGAPRGWAMRGAVDEVRAGPLDGWAVVAEAPGRTGW